MTPAWLITGPPGSGRSVAARAFAAALQCTDPDEPGCGACPGCVTTLSGSNADVVVVRPEGLSISIKEARALVLAAALAPVSSPWRVVLVEDADRLVRGTDERNAMVLLKSLEEPSPQTVYLLCAPSQSDLPATIRSRTRLLGLLTPSAEAIATVLRGEGVDDATAAFAAAAAQGHVGRARRLARDEAARARRAQVLRLPSQLETTSGCLQAAAALVRASQEDAAAVTEERDAQERAALERQLGLDSDAGPKRGAAARSAGAAVRELERQQKSRATRAQRDALDGALVDLAGLYRDVLLMQLGAPSAPAHADHRAEIGRLMSESTPERTLRRLEAVLATRQQLLDSPGLAALLAVESLALQLA
jgi:DNA polymerase-3 subunit delta'